MKLLRLALVVALVLAVTSICRADCGCNNPACAAENGNQCSCAPGLCGFDFGMPLAGTPNHSSVFASNRAYFRRHRRRSPIRSGSYVTPVIEKCYDHDRQRNTFADGSQSVTTCRH